MGNYEQLKQSVSDVIKTNGNQEITGSILQNVLLTIISTVGANATFAGIATPTTNPGTPDGSVFYLASESGTYSNFGGIELQDGLSVLMWNGSWSGQQIFSVDDEPIAGSDNLVRSGGVQEELALGVVYDVSAKNPTAGVNNDGKFESLSALLEDANLDTLIPTGARKGGMSIKFVQSSNNKYVQYRLMSNTFNTTEANWQGIDDEPTAGSNNLIKSSGVHSNNSWSLEEGEEFNVIDKKCRKGFSVGRDGAKARAYNIVDENGNIINTIRKLDEEPTANSKNPITSKGVFSNSSWSLEESEEFNVVDKNGKKGFSVGKDGTKARAYNIVDENGDIISTIGEDDKLGDGGFFQEKKGTYYFPSSISSSDSGLSYAVVGNEAKFKKSIKVEVNGIAPTSDTYWADRGALTINFDNPIKVKQTLSLWYFVPSKYWRQDYRGGDSNICLDRFHLYFYNGDTQIYHQYISMYEYRCGWNLFKFLTDDLANTTITKVEVRFYSYNNHPNFVCYLGHFVADQRMMPILNFNMDGMLDGITYTSGFAQWLMNNNMPVDLRLYGFGNYEEGEDGWKTITRKMYFSGLINGMTYSGEAKNYTLQQAVTYLKTGDARHGREAALYDIPAVRDIILCGAANNFVDDELLLAAKLAGYKMIRDANAYAYTSYIDSQCCVMPTFGVCGITDVTLSGEALDAAIAAKVSDAKSKIDKLIKYGMATSMFTHQVASKTQQGESGFNTLGSYAEGMEEIFSYALQKQSEGKLLIKSMYNIINNK